MEIPSNCYEATRSCFDRVPSKQSTNFAQESIDRVTPIRVEAVKRGTAMCSKGRSENQLEPIGEDKSLLIVLKNLAEKPPTSQVVLIAKGFAPNAARTHF